MFVARQVVRHRTANINEVSGRYSILPNEFYIPDPVMICTQSTDNNQGRSEVDKDRLTSVEREAISEAIKKHSIESYELYEHLIGDYNLSRELARMVLPVNVYTEFVWKMDLNNLFKFLMLRMDHHTQIETRMFANAIGILTESKFPLAYEAFNEHIRYATKFSMTETSYLRYRSDHTVLLSKLPEVEKRIGKRRAKEFKEKLGVK
jgi:thymidylate synthase (FAD)